MAKGKEINFDDPEEDSYPEMEDEFYQQLQAHGRLPEDIRDPEVRAKYEAWLKAQDDVNCTNRDPI